MEETISSGYAAELHRPARMDVNQFNWEGLFNFEAPDQNTTRGSSNTQNFVNITANQISITIFFFYTLRSPLKGLAVRGISLPHSGKAPVNRAPPRQ